MTTVAPTHEEMLDLRELCLPGAATGLRTGGHQGPESHRAAVAALNSDPHHDLLNDIGKEGVMADVLSWIEAHLT
jgi:hypothetical protein